MSVFRVAFVASGLRACEEITLHAETAEAAEKIVRILGVRALHARRSNVVSFHKLVSRTMA